MRLTLAALTVALSTSTALAQSRDSLTAAYSAADCRSCAEWNAPTKPVRLHGNAWYVGTRGLASVLITSPAGHVLLDAGLPESAPLIIENIRAAGFRVEDVKLVVPSHAHFDHVGGVAAIVRASGAGVAAGPSAAAVLRRGEPGRDDPQYGIHLRFPAVANVREIRDGDTLRVGPIALVARFTPGHTPGSTSWTWRSCDESGRCLDFVYADSQTPVSADGFLYTRSSAWPTAIADFERGHRVLERLACDVLVTPHPDASALWRRIEARDSGAADALIDPEGCRRYAAQARQRLARRVAEERQRP